MHPFTPLFVHPHFATVNLPWCFFVGCSLKPTNLPSPGYAYLIYFLGPAYVPHCVPIPSLHKYNGDKDGSMQCNAFSPQCLALCSSCTNHVSCCPALTTFHHLSPPKYILGHVLLGIRNMACPEVSSQYAA